MRFKLTVFLISYAVSRSFVLVEEIGLGAG